MPWTAGEFASRHNHKLSGAPAAKAASMANAIMRSGAPEGIAIATANKHADKMMHSHHAFGGIGMVHGDPLGKLATPHAVTGIGSSAPKMGGGAGGIGGGKGGSMSSSMQTPFWTRSAAREMDKPMAGGSHFAAGGVSTADEMPWWERQSARISDIPFHGGLIGGSGGGRTDQIPMSVPSGSHVLTADAVSGAGQGNTASGGLNILQALRIGPWGVPVPQEIKGHGPPHAPPVPRGTLDEESHGGAADGHHKRVSVLVASGEFVVPLEDWVGKDPIDGKLYLHRGVKSIGEGDAKKGHDRLDAMMKHIREFNIKWLKKAPKPKK